MANQYEGCKSCKFCHVTNTWTPPFDFYYTPKFLFVIEQYQPKAKERLQKLLKACNFNESNIEVAFLTRCWGGENQKGQIREGQHCKPLYTDLLSKVDKKTIVVPMGAVPCKVIAEAKSITTAHGTIIERDGRIIIPTLHYKQVTTYPDCMPVFDADLQVIKDAGEGKFAQQSGTEYINVDTIKKFQQMMVELWMSPAYAVDIESSSLDAHRTPRNPYIHLFSKAAPKIWEPKVLGLSFSNRENTAWWLPLDHSESPWTPRQRDWIVGKLKVLLEAKRGVQICHGGDFDYRYLKKALGITLGHYKFDTLLAHYIAVTEEKGTHALKILAWEFTDMGGYDDGLDEYKRTHPDCDADKGGSYANIPLSVLFPYAAGDADCTFRLYKKFSPLIEEGFRDLYYNLIIPANLALADMQGEGAPIDMDYWSHCNVEYPRIMGELLTEMRGYAEVIEVERFLTAKAKEQKAKGRLNRFRKRSADILKIQEVDPNKAAQMSRRLAADIEHAKSKLIVVEPVEFNPKSPDQKAYLLFEVMGYAPLKPTKGGGLSKGWDGGWSTDKEVLKDLWLEHNHPLIRLVGKWTKAKTLYSMFVENLPAMLGDDGRLRGGYNLAGTTTGRLSCANPNLQQIPRNLVEATAEDFIDINLPNIKGLFMAPDGFVLMQLDYSQAELRVLAALSGEPVFVEAFQNDEDIHQRVAAELFVKLLEEVTKEEREAAKKTNFGLLYGQGYKKLARTMRSLGYLDWTDKKAKEFIEMYFKRLKKVRKFIKKMKELVGQQGFVMTPFLRKRRLATAFSPDEAVVSRAERQAVNSPIQSAASDCMLLSLARANTFLRSRGLKSRLIITVHDSAILLVAVEELELVFTIMKKVMENPLYSEWLNGVRMKADVEVGKSWMKLHKVKKVEELPQVMEKIAA